MDRTRQDIEISVIVPIFNEEECVATLYSKLNEALKAYMRHEVIFIDDGSSDNSYGILERLSRQDEKITVIRFPFNKGQHKAVEEGFRQARGKIIITMDGDMQNDPADIPRFIGKIHEGFDLVCGWRKKRKDPWHKKIKSIMGNMMQRRITGVKLHDMACFMRAYRPDMVKRISLRRRNEIGFIPYMISKKTEKITEIEVVHHPRRSGRSKYGFFSTSLGVIRSYIRILRRGI